MKSLRLNEKRGREREKLSLPGIWFEWMVETFTEMRNVGEVLEGR